MSVLVYIESENESFKKTALEVASYGRALANKMKCSLNAVVFNANNNAILGDYGVDKIISIKTEQEFIAEIYADYLRQVAIKENSQVVILSNSANCKYLAPFLSVGLKAGYVPNVVKLPVTVSPFLVKRSAFTNKAFFRN
jgi:electron transfer flavoprotein alpha subunit